MKTSRSLAVLARRPSLPPRYNEIKMEKRALFKMQAPPAPPGAGGADADDDDAAAGEGGGGVAHPGIVKLHATFQDYNTLYFQARARAGGSRERATGARERAPPLHPPPSPSPGFGTRARAL